MRGFGKLIWVNLKLNLREPIGTFFALAFPPLLVVLFGAMYGNDPSPMFGGYGSMDVAMPGYTAMILGTVGLLSVPITISGYRESGILRRFQATPMRPLTYVLADIAANLVTTLVGMVGLVIVGWLLYRVHFEGQQVIGMVIFYPMMFLSGASIPLEILPEAVQRAADYLPLTYVVRLLRGLWFGNAWGEHLLEIAVLGGVLVVCSAIAARFFRWE